MLSRPLRWLAVILVNLGILAAIELGSAWVIQKRFRKANASYKRDIVVEQPFAIPTGWEMKANATIGDSVTTRIRTDGKGRAIVPDPLPHPRFTLAILGGSSIFGVGVTDNGATVPSQVQALLRREYALDVNVISLAARGYVSLQELLVLNQCLAEQPLNMVVSISGYNDFVRYLGGERNTAYVNRSNSDAVLLVRRVEAGNLVVANLVPALRRLSHTANLAVLAVERRQERVKRGQEAAKDEQDAAKEKQEAPKRAPEKANGLPEKAKGVLSAPNPTFLDSHLAHYAMMQAVCEVHHTYFKLFLQPNAFTKANLSKEEKSNVLRRNCSGSQDKLDSLTLAHNTYRVAFDARPKTFPFTDLADAFGQTNTQVYRDACHYNEAGATQLAQAIAANLAPIIRSLLEPQQAEP